MKCPSSDLPLPKRATKHGFSVEFSHQPLISGGPSHSNHLRNVGPTDLAVRVPEVVGGVIARSNRIWWTQKWHLDKKNGILQKGEFIQLRKMGDFCNKHGIWPPYLWRFPEVKDPKNSPSSLLVYWTSLGKPMVKTGAPTLRNTVEQGISPTWGCQQWLSTTRWAPRLSQRIRSSPWKVVRTEPPGFVPQWNEASFRSQHGHLSSMDWFNGKINRKRNGFPYEIWGSNRPCSDSQSVALRSTSTRFSSYTPPIQAGCLCSKSWRGLERWSW